METHAKTDLPPSATITGLWSLAGPLLHAQRYKFLLVVATLPVSSVMAMLTPYLTMVAIDKYIVPAAQTGNLEAVYEPLLQLIMWAAGVVIAGYLADAIYVSTLQRTGQTLIANLREIVFKRTLLLPRSYFDTHPIGTVLTRVTSDIEALGESLATGSLGTIVDLLKTLAYLAMMFALNWRLTLVLLLVMPVLAFLIFFFQSRVRKSFFIARQALSEATGYLQECLSGVKTIQLYGAEKLARDHFLAKNERFLKAQNSSNFYDALLFALVEGVTTLSLALMLWYAAGELLAGFLTLGVLVAFIEYIQRLLVPVREFSQQIAVLQRAMAALEHINELVRVPLDPAEVPAQTDAGGSGSEGRAAEPARPGAGPAAGPGAGAAPIAAPAPRPAGEQPQPAAGGEVTGDNLTGGGDTGGDLALFRSLEFSDVRFRYGDDAPEILKGISFKVEQGDTLAIVGATGSGKSTLIRLLTRAYSGYRGSIRLNGEELSTISAARLSRLISVVHQNIFLYTGTLAFNIGLGRQWLDRGRIEQAARYVNAQAFVNNLEGGFDFEILQGGANLSAGEGQLVSLARAVVAETELIVLDEATSAVDSMTEKLIQEAVGKLYEDKTVIAIAHRLSTIRNADTILVLDAGQVAEAGSHSELLARGGLYAELVGKMEENGE